METIKNIVNDKMVSYGSAILLALLFILLAWPQLAFYFRFDFNFILLLLVFPFVVYQKSNQPSARYGFLALILFALFLVLKLSSVYFFAFVCSMFFLYESRFGKLNSLPLFLIMVASPVVIFVLEVVGFEIRLYLTELAVFILSFLSKDYHAVGNMIYFGEEAFSVDPACMGLKMVLMGFIVTVLFISFHQRQSKKEFPFWAVIISLLLSFLLVIVSNLFRIISITLFKAFPETAAHDFIGLICFVFYAVVPLWFFVKWISSKGMETEVQKSLPSASRMKQPALLTLMLLSFLLLFKFTALGEKSEKLVASDQVKINLDNFKSSSQDHGVLKLENEDLLIYIKPALRFYSADHSPIICWKGSGYQLTKENIKSMDGQNVFYGELLQGEDHLYTSWWYDSGLEETISQFNWRSQNLLNGTDYYLVNIISHHPEILQKETKKLLAKQNWLN